MIINYGNLTTSNIRITDKRGVDLFTLDQWAKISCEPSAVVDNANITINNQGLISHNSSAGFMLKSDEKHFCIQLGGELDPYIYRGQNKDYEYIMPSAQRVNKNNQDELIKYYVDCVKKATFQELFKQLPYYTRLSKMSVLGKTFDFDLEALAQHYGFLTNYVDTTTDLNVAMFFAYTTYDYKTGIYAPITDFNTYSPTLYVCTVKDFILNQESNNFKVVGFQAALRPVNQKAMAIDVKEYKKVKEAFKVIHLPKDPLFALGVYNSFRKGLRLFPQEAIAHIASDIQSSNLITERLLKDICRNNNQDYEIIAKQIMEYGYIITDKELEIDTDIISHMHLEITSQILPWINANIGYRGCSKSMRNFTE